MATDCFLRWPSQGRSSGINSGIFTQISAPRRLSYWTFPYHFIMPWLKPDTVTSSCYQPLIPLSRYNRIRKVFADNIHSPDPPPIPIPLSSSTFVITIWKLLNLAGCGECYRISRVNRLIARATNIRHICHMHACLMSSTAYHRSQPHTKNTKNNAML